jgi:hypothetical protein
MTEMTLFHELANVLPLLEGEESDETGARTRAAQNSIPAVRYAIYDGRLLVATVRRIGKKFEVRHAKRRLTGRFSSFKAALAAINDHAEHDHNRAPHGRK